MGNLIQDLRYGSRMLLKQCSEPPTGTGFSAPARDSDSPCAGGGPPAPRASVAHRKRVAVIARWRSGVVDGSVVQRACPVGEPTTRLRDDRFQLRSRTRSPRSRVHIPAVRAYRSHFWFAACVASLEDRSGDEFEGRRSVGDFGHKTLEPAEPAGRVASGVIADAIDKRGAVHQKHTQRAGDESRFRVEADHAGLG